MLAQARPRIAPVKNLWQVAQMEEIHRTIRLLYTGQSQRARRFRYGLIIFDALTILYFIATAALPATPTITGVNTALGLLIALDLAARLWISNNLRRELTRIYTLADLVVTLSLLLAPFLPGSFAFLRVLRGLRLIHAYHLLRDLRRDSLFFRRHEDAILAAVNLFVFIFVTTSLVFVLAFDGETGVAGYVDALYFTVATLTTTGFGDITMTTTSGKLLSVFIMVVGVALFVQLARAIFQPSKIKYKCPECGLNRHETDAIHCKHCGEPLKIETEGETAT
ncbi:ion channel [Sulfitobacter sp. AS92]|uniref:ion channel n=1 Tax=Sulfitobacter sp. AS92 TaxID=3135783 RepID=UPI00317FDFD0